MQIKAPDLGVESAEVAEILVKVGDFVAQNDNIVLVESDKASIEIPSPADGVISQILIAVGDTISEGTPLFVVTAEQGDSSHSAQPEPSQEQPSDSKLAEPQDNTNTPVVAQSPTSQSYALPDLGVESAVVAEVMAAQGDSVQEGEPILLVESDKASVEVPAPATGMIEQILVKAGDSVASGANFVVIKGQGQGKTDEVKVATSGVNDNQGKDSTNTSPKVQASTQVPNTPTTSGQNSKEIYAGPAVRKLARQMGIDIAKVKGSAINGRIIKEDLFSFVKQITQSLDTQVNQPSKVSVSSGLPALPDMSNAEIWGETEVQELSRLQKVSIPQLNLNTYLPQVTQFDLADITDTEAMRSAIKDEFKAKGIGLTILAFIVKAVAYALMQNPKFNSHLSDDNTQLIIRKTVNMGIAVATDDGLIVPVIKDAQDKSISQIAREIGDLAKKARDKKLGAKELQGASFTISSQGNLGGTYFTPLVNFPQVAILGISESSFQPRWNGKEFEPRLMLPLSLSYDHRVINGADAAVFTRYIAKLLADPRRILL